MSTLNFKELRKKCGLTQEEVAKKIGISRTAYTNIENGRREGDYNTLIKLADIYNVSVDELIRYVPLDDVESESVITCDDIVIKDFQQMCNSMSPTTLDRIHTILYTIKRLYKNEELTAHTKQYILVCLSELLGRIELYIDTNSTTYDDISPTIYLKSATKLIQSCENILKDIVNNVSGVFSLNNNLSENSSLIIPCYFQPASAGTGLWLSDDTPTEWLTIPKTDISDQADFIINVRGNSMEPKYFDGDKVLVKQSLSVYEGEVGVFILNGESYIKKLGKGELISLNPEYDPIKLKEFDDYRCVGKVLGIAPTAK